MKEMIKVKLAESIKLSFHYPPAVFLSVWVFPLLCETVVRENISWMERNYFQIQSFKEKLENECIFTIRFRKKETPGEVYSDS